MILFQQIFFFLIKVVFGRKPKGFANSSDPYNFSKLEKTHNYGKRMTFKPVDIILRLSFLPFTDLAQFICQFKN